MPDSSHIAPPLPGFESVNRYWDRRLQCVAAKILPGEYYISKGQEAITTVLGSCVAACIRDPVMGICGMNHFMLPLQSGESWSRDLAIESLANRYGNHAMEHLITDILKYGGRKKGLEVKIFGGARIIGGLTDIGDSNIRFVRNFLELENIGIAAQDVGGTNPRKIIFFPQSGKVLVKKIQDLHNDTISRRETDYIDRLESSGREAVVDLFGQGS